MASSKSSNASVNFPGSGSLQMYPLYLATCFRHSSDHSWIALTTTSSYSSGSSAWQKRMAISRFGLGDSR